MPAEYKNVWNKKKYLIGALWDRTFGTTHWPVGALGKTALGTNCTQGPAPTACANDSGEKGRHLARTHIGVLYEMFWQKVMLVLFSWNQHLNYF